MTDESVRQNVLDELSWEPSVDGAHIGVTAREGVVTLTGHVTSYAEKMAAEHAAERVFGVKAVAQNLEVRYTLEADHADDDVAHRTRRCSGAAVKNACHNASSAFRLSLASRLSGTNT